MATGKKWDRRAVDKEKKRKVDPDWVDDGFWSHAWAFFANSVVLSGVAILGLFALLAFGGFQIRKVLMPAEESLRREVFEQSKSYIDGTIRDLDNLRLQWLGADNDVQKAALASVATQRAADFPRDELPERIREWLREIE